jgi:hypothetical protein
MESAAIRSRAEVGERSWAPRGIGATEVRVALAVAMVLSIAAALWFGRNGTFSIDEVAWFAQSPHLTLRDAIQPYNGHLILTTRLVYAASFNLFGPDYLPIRLLTIGTLLLSVGLLFVFAERRVGSLPALAPAVVLLFFGSDWGHVLVGNGFTVLLAIAAGIGALLAIERRDLAGDIGAFALLCLAMATYTFGVAFAAGVAVFVLIGADRWRRAWVFVIPGVLYAAWFVWSRGKGTGGEATVHVSNLLLAPDWALNSIASAGSSLLGVGYDALGTGWGPVIALIAIVALGWRLWQGSISPSFWMVMGVAAALWAIEVSAALPGVRVPSTPRYLFAGTVAVLLIAAEAARGRRWGPRGIVTLYVVAAVGLMTNIFLLNDGSKQLRSQATTTRATLTALELSGGRVGPVSGRGNFLDAQLRLPGIATGYFQASREFGSPAYSLTELKAQPEDVRQKVDSDLANDLGVRLTPASGPGVGCQRLPYDAGQPVSFRLPSGGAVLTTNGGSAPVMLRRFGTAFTVEAGTLSTGAPAALVLPPDSAPEPWYASTATGPVSLCKAPG